MKISEMGDDLKGNRFYSLFWLILSNIKKESKRESYSLFYFNKIIKFLFKVSLDLRVSTFIIHIVQKDNLR